MDASPRRTRDRSIANEHAALRRVAVRVASGAPPEEVFAAVAEEVGRLLEVDFAGLVRYDPQDAITIAGTWTRTGAPAPTPVGNRLQLGGRNVTTLVHETGQPQRIDYDDVSGAIGDVATRDWRLRSSAGVPIRVEGRLWGVMIVAFTRGESLPPDADARLAGFTELVATAIANAQARAELREFAEEQAALRRDALAARSVLPPTARVIMVHVDELTLLKRLVAHAAGVLLCLQKQVEQLLGQPVARNPVLPVGLLARLR